MPLEQQFNYDSGQHDDVDESLFGNDGKLTAEAETLAAFLNDVNYDAIFEDEDVAEFVEESEEFFRPDPSNPDLLIPCEESDEGAVCVVVETLDGEIAAEFVDEDDLHALLAHYVNHELPRDTLEGKLTLGLFADVLSEDTLKALDEKSPFKKGDFRKGPMKGVSPKSGGSGGRAHNQRVRMMMAMMKKGDIKRVGKGKGYKGGDYKYGKDKSANPAKYKQMRGTLHRRAGQIQKMNIDPKGRKKIVGVIYKNLGKSMPKNWVPPEKRGTGGKPVKGGGGGKIFKAIKKAAAKKDKSSAKAASKNIFAKKKGKSIDASTNYAPDNVTESKHSLTGAALKLINRHVAALNESAKKD